MSAGTDPGPTTYAAPLTGPDPLGPAVDLGDAEAVAHRAVGGRAAALAEDAARARVGDDVGDGVPDALPTARWRVVRGVVQHGP